MSDSNQVQAIQIDDKAYSVADLSDEAKEVVATISQNQQVAQLHEATLRQVNIAGAALQNALKELVADLTPIEVAEPAAEAAPVTVTE